MEDHPVTIRIFPGDLCPVYFTSVIVFHTTEVLEVIRLSLERLQIFEDKTLYELYRGHANSPKIEWTKIEEGEYPVALMEKLKREGSEESSAENGQQELRFYLQRKEHASLVLAEIVSQYISPEVNEGRVQDMCDLEEFTEQDMLSNLRARFSNKDIYTYVGSILISINPYYFYSIYNPKYASMYQEKALGALPPHIFAVADNAYHTMLNERQDQSVIISGESGAGKTESTKFLLHHFMSLSAKLDESQSLELITLGTGPVLEAFGNARTVANNNSSRFGKFILVQFKENGAYHGASIEKYLLEKSRIISQAPEERNYHVFYYLLEGADPELKRKLKLGVIDDYKYLTQGSSLTMANGAEEYHRLRQSLSMLGFGTDVQMGMFTVLSAILQLGNVVINKMNKQELEVATIKDLEPVEVIASLLQVDVATLTSALTTRTSKAGGTDSFVTPYRVDQALAARDSMAKALYGALFDWIVDKVNVTLAAGKNVVHKGNSIGVLDIFGFEVFQKNSFEQFCINYANEQLQQYFNKHIFKVEQAEYIAENIEWSSVSFVDNQECLDLIAKKPTGLLSLLDEECSFPGADDNSLYQKFERQHKSNPCYYSPPMKQNDPQFTVSHYASEVSYSIKGFREKNRDLMRQDIVDVLKTSHMDLVRALIGQPPFALHCWKKAHMMLRAVAAFRKAGQVYKQKKESPSFQFKLRIASSPQLASPTHPPPTHGHPVRGRNLSDEIPQHQLQQSSDDKDGEDAFAIQHGHMKAGLGVRPSRSYDMLTNMSVEVDREGMVVLSSSVDCSRSFVGGASPKASRRKQVNPKATPPLPTTLAMSSKTSTLPLNSTPQYGKASKKSEGSPPRTRKRHSSFTRKKEDPTVLRTPKKEKEDPGGKSRLSSLSRMQQKLRRRLSRNFKTKELVPEQPRERPSDKYWSSSPRIRMPDGSNLVDGRLCPLARTSSMRHGPPKTISGQFQVSLLSLMERLEVTNPYFVRCLKSNGEKAPCKFDSDLVMRQLRYTGMMETIKIRKAGYPVRMDFEAFYERYQFLIGPKSSNLAEQIKEFLQSLGFCAGDIQIGMTKVFMREKQKRCLQEELGDKVLARIIKIQRWVRAKMFRCRFLHLRRNAITIQCAVRSWLAREKVNVLRKRVCSAVLIQSAWRGTLARKRLFFMQQAAIILQTHWRGKSARLAYKDILEERRRREREAKEEEERRRIEREAKEEEERLRLEEENRRLEEKEEARRASAEAAMLHKVEAAESGGSEEGRLRGDQGESTMNVEGEQDMERIEITEDGSDKVVSRLLPTPDLAALRTSSALSMGSMGQLDSDVRDVLFQFDSIVTALEQDTLKDSTPSPDPSATGPKGTPRATSPLVTSGPHPLATTSGTDFTPTLTTSGIFTSSTLDTSPGVVNSNFSNGIHSERTSLSQDDDVLTATRKCSVTPPLRLSVTPPPPHRDSEKLVQLRNAAKVQELKQKLLSGGGLPLNSQKLISRQKEIEKAQKTCSTKVKTIVKQMSTPVEIPETEKMSVSPPPSPIDKDLEKVRKNVAISEKITHLHQSVDESKEKKHSSYKPSTLRRKVVSPFLGKRTGGEETQSSSTFPESAKQMKKSAQETEGGTGEQGKPLLQSSGSFDEEFSSQTGAVPCLDSEPASGSHANEEAVLPGEMSKRTQDNVVEDTGEKIIVPIVPKINEPSSPEHSNSENESQLPREVTVYHDTSRGEEQAPALAVSSSSAVSTVPSSPTVSSSPTVLSSPTVSSSPTVLSSPTVSSSPIVSSVSTVVEEHGGINGIARHLEDHSGEELDKTELSPVHSTESPPPPSHSRDRSEGSDAIPLESIAGLSTVDAACRENSYTADPSLLKTSTESRSSSRSSTPYSYRSYDRRSREKSYDSTSLASSGSSYDRRRVATPSREKEEEPAYMGPSYIVDGEKDDDHLVSIVLPFRSLNNSSSSSGSSSKKKKEHQYSSGSIYTPSGSIYNSGSRRRRKPDPTPPPPLPPPRKSNSSNPLSVDDVFVSFKDQGEESRTAGGRKMHRAGSDGRPISSNIADVISGVRENGVLSSNSQLTDMEGERLNASYSFDRHSDGKASEYDHLTPLDQLGGYKSGRNLRPRTTSDVSSHRLRTRKKHEDFTASEVVPREYQSAEHHFNSVQRRKRSALSLADPAEIMKTRGNASLEESCELTRCLTPEEIMNLNQGRPTGSPSDRARLFSITKGFKNPFAKSRSKKEKDMRDRLVSPDKEQQTSLAQYQQQLQPRPQQQQQQGRSTPSSRHHHKHSSPVAGRATLDRHDGLSNRRHSNKNIAVSLALAHNFTLATMGRFSVYTCGTCGKGFTGFMKQGLKCTDCNIVVHRHCEDRAPACKARIESGAYVTMSRKKIIQKAEDLDDLGRFLLDKIAVLARDSSHNSVVDKVFKQSLKEFHTFLISTYSLSLQNSVESKEGASSPPAEEPRINLTLSQLVCNFDNIFRGIAKKEGLNDPNHIAIGVNQLRTILDEFGKARRTRKYSSNINPSALRRKTPSGSDIQPKLHKGHKFVPQQFQVPTVCEHCSKGIPFLETGDVCQVCGYTCHEGCLKKVHKKCEGKGRAKQAIPEYQPNPKVDSKQFGIPIENLVLPNSSTKIPPILETCFKHIEASGLYTQGVYRKSAGVSSKKAVRAVLEDKPENADLEPYSVHAVAAAVGGFFRELPEPLLTRDMYMEFLRAMDLTDKKERQKTLHKLISRLPEVNHAVFERLIFHLARIAQHEHINRMGAGNLAIIFAPCLLQGNSSCNPEEMLKDIQKQTDCLEAIITEQVEKLTATIRGIRTLDSYARETETKLSKLISQFDSSQSTDSTPSSTLKEPLPVSVEPQVERKGMTDEERKRLTCTLVEIERERAELTVNLTKLEPFLSAGEEEEHGSLDSDHLTTPSPSPSPLTFAQPSRSQRMFSPITESGLESPLPPRHPNSSQVSGNLLPSLTKNRVSSRPRVRPPSSSRRRQKASASITTSVAAAPLAHVASEVAVFAVNTSAYSHNLRPYSTSPENSPLVSDNEDESLLFETTV